jgi:hypothetical protein
MNRRIYLTVCCLLALAVLITGCALPFPEEAQVTNQVRAGWIIHALDQYQQDHGHLPDHLEDLQPDYLAELPRTTRGHPFSYVVSDAAAGRYSLCFLLRPTDHGGAGCCYVANYYEWACGS